MSSEKPKVELVGIEDTPEVRLQCEFLLESLQSIAPSDAFLKAIFVKFGRTFEGVVCINSTAGRFTVAHQHRSMAQLMQVLRDSMISKLKDWKKGRFDPLFIPAPAFDHYGAALQRKVGEAHRSSAASGPIL